MEQFDQLLTCCICLDRYKKPTLLPCQHSYCLEPCMEGLIDYVKRQVKCPECRAEHRIPYNGIQGFPINYTLQKFLELHTEITGELPDPNADAIMQRCAVCSERAYVNPCAHCDKKCCNDCKEAHCDILKREISRINNQIKRGWHRLEDCLLCVERNTLSLEANAASVLHEIDEIDRRLSKAVKERTNYLKASVDKYLNKEMQALKELKSNLDLELTNIQSNSDLMEKHLTDESTKWDDNELMDTKDIFIKMMDFIRNYDPGSEEYSRRIRFNSYDSVNDIAKRLLEIGDLKCQENGLSGNSNGSKGHEDYETPIRSSGLSRSKSDHRLVAEFRRRENESSPPPVSGGVRRRFGDSRYSRDDKQSRNVFGNGRHEDEDDEDSKRSFRFRSRFLKPDDNEDFETRKSSFFPGDDEESPSKKSFRNKVLETEDASRGPLSGCIRLADSTRIIQRLKEMEMEILRRNKVNSTHSVVTESLKPKSLPVSKLPQIPSASHDDEIDRIKRENKKAEEKDEESSSRTSDAVSVPPHRNPQTHSSKYIAASGCSNDDSSESDSSSESSEEETPVFLSQTQTQTESLQNKEEEEDENDDEYEYYDDDEEEEEEEPVPQPQPVPVPKSEPEHKGNHKPKFETEHSVNYKSKSELCQSISKTTTPRVYSGALTTSILPSSSQGSSQPSSGSSGSHETVSILSRFIQRNKRNESEKERNSEEDEEEMTKKKMNTNTNSTNKNKNRRDGDDDSFVSRYLAKSQTPSESKNQIQAPQIPEESTYPSGRSRIDILKDRKDKIARSKSSAYLRSEETERETETETENDRQSSTIESRTPFTSRFGGELSRSRSSHTLQKEEFTASSKSSEPYSEESHLSSWAKYLKSKYGSRKKTSEDSRKNFSSNDARPKGRYSQKQEAILSFGTRGSQNGYFTWPRGIAVGPDNTIVVADSSNHRVQIFTETGEPRFSFGGYGNTEGEFDCLAGVAVNRIGQYIIADRYNHRIQIFDSSGIFLRAFGSQGSSDGQFSYPWGITTDALGFIYVCDKENHRVQVFQSDGSFVGKFGVKGSKPGQLEHPHYIAVSNTNRVIVSDSNNHRIQIFDVHGKVLTTFGSEGTEEGQFKFPRGVAVDEEGHIFVADSGNNRIQIFNPDGTFLKAFGRWGQNEGEFKGLEGIAVNAQGNILIADRENHRVQMF